MQTSADGPKTTTGKPSRSQDRIGSEVQRDELSKQKAALPENLCEPSKIRVTATRRHREGFADRGRRLAERDDLREQGTLSAAVHG